MNEFFYINNLDVQNLVGQQKIIFDELNLEYKIPIHEEKYIKRFQRVQLEKASEIFNAEGKFSLQIFDYAMTEYFEKDFKSKKDSTQEEHLSEDCASPAEKNQWGQKGTGFATKILGLFTIVTTGYMAYLTYHSSILFN